MKLDEEKVNMMAYVMGRAVIELVLAEQPITQQSIIDKLEQFRGDTGNLIGKGINRYVAEIVRKGSKAVK